MQYIHSPLLAGGNASGAMRAVQCRDCSPPTHCLSATVTQPTCAQQPPRRPLWRAGPAGCCRCCRLPARSRRRRCRSPGHTLPPKASTCCSTRPSAARREAAARPRKQVGSVCWAAGGSWPRGAPQHCSSARVPAHSPFPRQNWQRRTVMRARISCCRFSQAMDASMKTLRLAPFPPPVISSQAATCSQGVITARQVQKPGSSNQALPREPPPLPLLLIHQGTAHGQTETLGLLG